jgi:hypothetical protein
MTSATLTYSRMYKKVQKKIDSASLPDMNWKMICFSGFLMCIFALIFYIYQINILTKGTYLINSYDKKIAEISEVNKKLEVSFAENSFLGEVLVKTQQLDFQKTSSVKYIQIPASSVAIAKR